MSAELEVQQIVLAALLLALMETAARMAARPGPVAATYCKNCWDTLAELELGGNCSEAARTLVSSADKWLASAA